MDLQKTLILLGAGILAILILYGLILGATTVYTSYQVEQTTSDSNNDELMVSLHEAPDIDVVKAEENYILRLRNTGDEEIMLEKLEFSANEETITEQVSYGEDSIPVQETTEVDTGVETGETVSFKVSAEDTSTYYECDYTEGAATC